MVRFLARAGGFLFCQAPRHAVESTQPLV